MHQQFFSSRTYHFRLVALVTLLFASLAGSIAVDKASSKLATRRTSLQLPSSNGTQTLLSPRIGRPASALRIPRNSLETKRRSSRFSNATPLASSRLEFSARRGNWL